MKKKNLYFNKVTVAGFVKNLLIMMKKKLEIIAAHWNCNINFQLSKNVPVIFHNLRGYNSHLILKELDRSDVKISVIPNGLEKYMAFFF